MKPSRATNVLVVEDSPGDALLVETALDDAVDSVFRIRRAATLAAALDELREGAIDIVLTDLGLPDSDGIGTVRAIRAAAPETPIVVLTSFGYDTWAVRALEEGAQDYLFKGSVDEALITRAIRYAIVRKREENQLHDARKIAAVGTLASGVAHDFNNLLTVILGECALLTARRQLEPDVRDVINRVRSSAIEGALLVQQLSAYAGAGSVAPHLVDVNRAVRDAQPLLERQLGTGIELEFDLADVAPWTRIDPAQLTTILLQFARNARDATTDGGRFIVSTRVTILGTDDTARFAGLRPGTYVEISTEDNGVGIAPENLHRIFDPFYTTHGGRGRVGMGLAEVYGITKHNGGHVAAFSEPGKGTVMDVYLPSLPAPQATTAAPGADHAGTETILVLENEPAVQSLVSRALATCGYAVLGATDSARALRLLDDHGDPIDALLTDATLDGPDAEPLVERLAALRPRVAVVCTTAAAQQAWKRGLDPAARCVLLEKPFTVERLTRAVRAALDSRNCD